MIIAIIGSGNVGSALAHGLVRAGHSVTFGVRDAGSAKSQKAQALLSVPMAAVAEACRQAEVIIITTPPEAVKDLVPDLGDVRKKVIIDATNSVRTRPEPYPTAFHALKALTNSEAVVKCFNSTGFENMLKPDYPGFGGIDMFCAGNDKGAKAIATKLRREGLVR